MNGYGKMKGGGDRGYLVPPVLRGNAYQINHSEGTHSLNTLSGLLSRKPDMEAFQLKDLCVLCGSSFL